MLLGVRGAWWVGFFGELVGWLVGWLAGWLFGGFTLGRWTLSMPSWEQGSNTKLLQLMDQPPTSAFAHWWFNSQVTPKAMTTGHGLQLSQWHIAFFSHWKGSIHFINGGTPLWGCPSVECSNRVQPIILVMHGFGRVSNN